MTELCLFQIGIARLHVVEGGIQTRVDRQIKLFCGVVCQRHAGGGCLCVVDQHVDIAESVHCFLDDMFHHSGIVCAGVDICLHRQNLNAVQAFQFLLGIGELLDIASGDDKVCALFGVAVAMP